MTSDFSNIQSLVKKSKFGKKIKGLLHQSWGGGFSEHYFVFYFERIIKVRTMIMGNNVL